MANSSKSFKRLGLPPPRYRTPSPPRHAIEPISPMNTSDTAIEALGMRWANYDNSSIVDKTHHDQCEDMRKRGHGSRGSMDAFASIALATSSIGSLQNNSLAVQLPFGIVIDESQAVERPSKRARSEKLPSPEWHRSGAKLGLRPATSYEQSADSRTLEAELLLNFSQEARFSVPWPSHQKGDSNAPQLAPSLIDIPNFSLKSLIDDQCPQNETPQMSSISQEDGPTLLCNSGTFKEQYGNGGSDSPGATSAQASPHQDPSLPQVGPNGVHELSDVYSTPLTSVMVSAYDSTASGRVHESAKKGIPNFAGHMDATKSDNTQDFPEVVPDMIQTGLGFFADHTTNLGDPNPFMTDGISRSTKENVVEAILKEPSQKAIATMGPPVGLVDVNETIAGEIAQNTETSSNLVLAIESAAEDSGARGCQAIAPAVCAACNFTRNSLSVENDNSSTSWISCDGCKAWFHFACAGFKSEREVRSVDKYRCRKCKPIHGPTTHVRKSARAHTAIDYAGLHQGVFKTSDETPEHHYIKPIKDGTISFQPESFARMRPELVTAEYFQKGIGMKEPVVIPAHFNPRPGDSRPLEESAESLGGTFASASHIGDDLLHEEWFSIDPEFQRVPDHGQDALDMVVPRDLTVRLVAELYGPEEKVEVIDVKSQNGEGKKWNMKRWADYYESSGNKIVRNVISLEVSQSKLGRLIRRPQIVRDLDLQDSVWPSELQSRGEYPRVQFYCLMSVADCFTDFHIDFGGSSVFYHILKGKKTFLFIPPKEKHLKKYEEWCMSPAQNWTFLADQTKECYRVDLSEGDTMLIPAGWIHAVWTPEDSLVIGGNFLTRLNYGMQLRIAQIEKATGVARKFRYPHFQRIHWYTALRYLADDPIPDSVKEILQNGNKFHRKQPAHYDFDAWGENSELGRENYHARYYSQAELEGLVELSRYLLRTALIDLGSITDGITTETRNAVKKAIPRGHGEPLDTVKRFAMWTAWKRGESIPDWASADAIPEGITPEAAAKLSTAAAKKVALEVALQGPRRHSARRTSQQHHSALADAQTLLGVAVSPKGVVSLELSKRPAPQTGAAPPDESRTISKGLKPSSEMDGVNEIVLPDASRKRKSPIGVFAASHRKPACDLCRKRRRACKHRDQVDYSASTAKVEKGQVTDVSEPRSTAWLDPSLLEELRSFADREQHLQHSYVHPSLIPSVGSQRAPLMESQLANLTPPITSPKLNSMSPRVIDGIMVTASQSRGRSKACNDCRKSKRRCIHDEHGNIDPDKANEAAIPRPAATLKRRKLDHGGQDLLGPTKPNGPTVLGSQCFPLPTCGSTQNLVEPTNGLVQRPAPVANMMGYNPNSAPLLILKRHSPVLQHQPSNAPSATPLQGDAELANQAVRQLNNAVLDTQIHADEKHLSDPSPLRRATEPVESTEDEVQLVAMPPVPDLKAEAGFVQEVSLLDESFSQPAASCLVSPPASSHNDAGRTSPTSEPKLTPSSSSSRHSSRHPKQVQRYTPDSGSTRRASSSSAADMMAGKSHSLTARGDSAHMFKGVDASAKRAKPRLSSDIYADEESLRLIKELQAQDYGLRRRERI